MQAIKSRSIQTKLFIDSTLLSMPISDAQTLAGSEI